MDEQHKQEAQTPDEQIRDYLARDLALSKLQLNESRRNSGKLLVLAILLIILIIACLGGFAATVYFITKEQTKQVQAIFNSDWEIRTLQNGECIRQDATGNSTAIINNHSNGSGIANAATK